MVFWLVTVAVLVLALTAAWLADRRRRGTDVALRNPASDRARAHDRNVANRYAQPTSPNGTQSS